MRMTSKRMTTKETRDAERISQEDAVDWGAILVMRVTPPSMAEAPITA
jgi:hypothetical protein